MISEKEEVHSEEGEGEDKMISEEEGVVSVEEEKD